MTMTLIETKTLGTAAASIEFTSIPSTFTDLRMFWSMRGTNSIVELLISINGSTSDFTARYLQGDGTLRGSATGTRIAGIVQNFSNTFSNGSLYLPNYTGSTSKSYSIDDVAEANQTTAYQTLVAGLWSNSAAINSITLTAASGDLVAGSTVSLYGILKGTDGIVTTS